MMTLTLMAPVLVAFAFMAIAKPPATALAKKTCSQHIDSKGREACAELELK